MPVGVHVLVDRGVLRVDAVVEREVGEAIIVAAGHIPPVAIINPGVVGLSGYESRNREGGVASIV